MKWKTTVILLVIAACVFAYLYFVERNRPGTEEAARQSQNVLNFSREKIDGVVIQNGDDKIAPSLIFIVNHQLWESPCPSRSPKPRP